MIPVMDWADWTLKLLPLWVMVVLGVINMSLGLAVWDKGKGARIVDSWQFLSLSLGILPLVVFHIAAIFGYADFTHGQAASRIAITILYVSRIVTLLVIRGNNGPWTPE